MNGTEVNQVIEALCQLGCREVRQVIARLEAGTPVSGIETLSAADRDRVLAELKAIMAVYGDNCRV